MSDKTTSSKRSREEEDPDVYGGSDDETIDNVDIFDETGLGKRQKRDKSAGGGLQAFTKYVCEKLEQEKEISNTEIADLMVKEHATGDSKKNDNIRRRVYDALSVIHAVGLAEKRGKTFVWMGRPSIPQPDQSSARIGKISRDLLDKRIALIRLMKRAVGLEYLRLLKRSGSVSSYNTSANGIASGVFNKRPDGEFQLPLLVLSTDSSARMLMETDSNNAEVYVRINRSYQLKRYDDLNKIETNSANCLLQTFLRSKIPKDMVEEALNLRLTDDVFRDICQAVSVMPPLSFGAGREGREGEELLGSAPGLNAIMSAAHRLESAGSTGGGEGIIREGSLRLPVMKSDEVNCSLII